MNKELNRCIGSFLGLAAGDALGTTLEFRTPGTFTPYYRHSGWRAIRTNCW